MIFCLVLVFVTGCATPCLSKQSEDIETLELFYDGTSTVSSAARKPVPISEVAENITVITSDEIQALSAHTMADILLHVPGVQVEDIRTPGSATSFQILGASHRHILVLLDGIPFSNSSDNFADLAAIPAGMVERVEIIKGPGSSSWGSSLGGVINIILKRPPLDDGHEAAASVSGGERSTYDLRGEVAGTSGRHGWYLYGGHLESKGIPRRNAVHNSSAYGVATTRLPSQTSLTLTTGVSRGRREILEIPEVGAFNDTYRYLFSTLTARQEPTHATAIEGSARFAQRRTELITRGLPELERLAVAPVAETLAGGSLKATVRSGMHAAAAGIDYDHIDFELRPVLRKDTDKWGLFANDTLSIGRFTVTPGLRYDRMQVADFLSPSLGITCRTGDSTTLRAYAGRGFSLPSILNMETERVHALQAGIESTALGWIWIKGTVFRNEIGNIATREPGVLQKQLKQGIELEFRTLPVHNTSLFGGVLLMEATDRDTGRTVPNIPSETYDIGVRYDDKKSLKATLVGHYVWWNTLPDAGGEYDSFIWDLTVEKTMPVRFAPEFFLTVHNLFNGASYTSNTSKTASRWSEAGIRFGF